MNSEPLFCAFCKAEVSMPVITADGLFCSGDCACDALKQTIEAEGIEDDYEGFI